MVTLGVTNNTYNTTVIPPVQEHISSVIQTALVKHSTSATGITTASQDINIVGNTGDVTGLDFSQLVNVNLSVLSQTTVNATMQSDMSTQISSVVSSALGRPVTPGESTIIQNSVASTFSVEAVTALNVQTQVSQHVLIAMNSGIVNAIKAAQVSNTTGKAVSSLSGTIYQNVIAPTKMVQYADHSVMWIVLIIAVAAVLAGGLWMRDRAAARAAEASDDDDDDDDTAVPASRPAADPQPVRAT